MVPPGKFLFVWGMSLLVPVALVVALVRGRGEDERVSAFWLRIGIGALLSVISWYFVLGTAALSDYFAVARKAWALSWATSPGETVGVWLFPLLAALGVAGIRSRFLEFKPPRPPVGSPPFLPEDEATGPFKRVGPKRGAPRNE
jgi:hypothetical protein